MGTMNIWNLQLLVNLLPTHHQINPIMLEKSTLVVKLQVKYSFPTIHVNVWDNIKHRVNFTSTVFNILDVTRDMFVSCFLFFILIFNYIEKSKYNKQRYTL